MSARRIKVDMRGIASAPPFVVTSFPNLLGRSFESTTMTMAQLAELLNATSALKKEHLPLLKLACFGDVWELDAKTGEQSSLRHDGNVTEVTGVVIDYDAELISIDVAAAKLADAAIECIVHTTPSHSASRPRWHVIAPLEVPVTGDFIRLTAEHRKLVQRIDNVLGNIAASESYKLSQPYYFGSVRGSRLEMRIIKGKRIDRHPGLDRPEPTSKEAAVSHASKVATDFDELVSAFLVIPYSPTYPEWTRIGLAFKRGCGKRADSDEARAAWLAHCAKYPDDDPAESEKKWSKLDVTRKRAPGLEVGPATIFKMAKELANWTPPPKAWGDAVDFLHEIAAPSFEVADVPAVIGEYAVDFGKASGFDPTIFIAAAMATIATALSDAIQLDVQKTTKWFESARLWTTVIAAPGTGKTPIIKAAIEPLLAIHDGMALRNTQPVGEDDPPLPRLATVTHDSTIEALAMTLADNPRGVLYMAHELDSWIGSHDAYRGGASKDRGAWLQLFDGGPQQIDRVSRGSTLVRNWAVSLLSATTPDALIKMRAKLPNDGLLQRVLTFFVKPPGESKTEHPTELSGKRYSRMVRAVYDFTEGGLVQFSGEAKAAFQVEQSRYRVVAPAMATISVGFAGHALKFGTFLARVLLVFHAAECAMVGKHPTKVPVPLATYRLAERFLRKCFLHSRILYEMLGGADSALQLAKDVAAAIVADRYEHIARRDLVQGLNSFREASKDNGKVQHEAMQLLCDFDWLRVVPGKYVKGYATHWAVNPGVYAKYHEYGERLKERRALAISAIAAAHAERQP